MFRPTSTTGTEAATSAIAPGAMRGLTRMIPSGRPSSSASTIARSRGAFRPPVLMTTW
jgi:hypothetical protein